MDEMDKAQISDISPQEELAKDIVDELIENKLVKQQQGAGLVKGLVSGTLKREDWSLLVEIATEKNQQGAADG